VDELRGRKKGPAKTVMGFNLNIATLETLDMLKAETGQSRSEIVDNILEESPVVSMMDYIRRTMIVTLTKLDHKPTQSEQRVIAKAATIAGQLMRNIKMMQAGYVPTPVEAVAHVERAEELWTVIQQNNLEGSYIESLAEVIDRWSEHLEKLLSDATHRT
jgi:hypothetical protein